MKLSRKVAVIMLTAALTLSLCVISVLPARGRPGMDAMTYNIDTLPARDLIPAAGGPVDEPDYTPPARTVSAEASDQQEAAESAGSSAQKEAAADQETAPAAPAVPASSTSVLAVGIAADSVPPAVRLQYRQLYSDGAVPGHSRVCSGPGRRLVPGELRR